MSGKMIGIFAVFVLLLVGCQASGGSEQLSDQAVVAKQYIEQAGYKVLSYEGKVSTYKLTKDLVGQLPHAMYWSLPGNDPEKAYGKTVEVEKFIVSNHPLDNYQSGSVKAKGKTEVYVHLAEGRVVAGTSFPVTDTPPDGGYWNIHGISHE
ncbi:hypothetical protein [Paenibacillus sp. GCM10027626]|uniref:hypothetical protein n=1 Tax=Paenibacillus sp. GCM10027626 TaxID=3273411 RepID=UPI00363E0B5C